MTADSQITVLLRAASAGDARASSELFEAVYTELRSIARAHRRRWSGQDTLNTTALIHEAYLKLAGSDLSSYADRTHFYATAARAMRQVLINYAERVSAAKRGGGLPVITLAGEAVDNLRTFEELLHIDQLLTRLEAEDPRQCRLVECRVFGGMTTQECALALSISEATVKRDWALLRAWMYRELQREGGRPE